MLLNLASLVAMACLVAEYGFYLPAAWLELVHQTTYWIMGYFAVQTLLKFFLVDDILDYLRRRWMAHVLTAVLVVQYVAFKYRNVLAELLDGWLGSFDIQQATQVYLAATQVQLAVMVLLHSALLSRRMLERKIQPARATLLTFTLVIGLGTLALMVPKASHRGLEWTDALFTATSAVCVTGLTTVNPATELTFLGQLVVLVLIQLGGLGIMTLTTFFAVFLGDTLALRQKVMVGSVITAESVSRMSVMLRRIILFTFVLEGIGAAVLLRDWLPHFDNRWKALWHAAFHSVSAFCSAGFSIFPEGMAGSWVTDRPVGLGMVCTLVILGGLGYPVLSNLQDWAGNSLLRRRRRVPLAVHTRLVLVMTLLLVVLGTAAVWWFERAHTLAGMGPDRAALHAFAQAVFPRTAGFNSVNLMEMAVPTVLVVLMLMFVGAGPSSTAGGIRVTTFVVSAAFLAALFRGHERVNIAGREVPQGTLFNVAAMIMAYLGMAAAATFALVLLEGGRFEPLRLLFEVVSALSTVGLTLDVTPHLSTPGKLLVAVTMLVGRLGVLTFFWAFFREPRERSWRYPKEEIVVF